MFTEFYPTWTARCYKRKFSTILYPFNKLSAFFHDGEVRREVHVEHLIKAQTLERSNHLAGDAGAYRYAELLAQTKAHSRSRLDDDVLCFVSDEYVPVVSDAVVVSAGEVCVVVCSSVAVVVYSVFGVTTWVYAGSELSFFFSPGFVPSSKS